MTGTREELATRIRGCRQNSGGARQYPAALRAEIVGYLEREVRAGGHYEELCRQLGVHSMLTRRWRRAVCEGGFAAVAVVEDGVALEADGPSIEAAVKPVPAARESSASPVTLTSPTG